MPTGQEWVVQTIMGINQGASGVVSWNDPTSEDIKSAASALAKSLPEMVPWLFDPAAVRKTYVVGGASVATWTKAEEGTLVLATNANYAKQMVEWSKVCLEGSGVKVVFENGKVEVGDGGLTLGPVGSAAFVVTA